MPVSCFVSVCCYALSSETIRSSLIFIPNCGPIYLFYIYHLGCTGAFWVESSTTVFLLVKIIAYCSFVKQYCYLFSDLNFGYCVHFGSWSSYFYLSLLWLFWAHVQLVCLYFLCLAFPYSVTIN